MASPAQIAFWTGSGASAGAEGRPLPILAPPPGTRGWDGRPRRGGGEPQQPQAHDQDLSNPQFVLFRRPTGLADGLALKELAPPAGSPRNSPQGCVVPPFRGCGVRPRIRRAAIYRCRPHRDPPAPRRRSPSEQRHRGDRSLTSAAMRPRAPRIRRIPALGAALALAFAVAGCGGAKLLHQTSTVSATVTTGVPSASPTASQGLGFPLLATKNTTRVDGTDPIADAAGVALAVYPSAAPGTHPPAVALAPTDDWQ